MTCLCGHTCPNQAVYVYRCIHICARTRIRILFLPDVCVCVSERYGLLFFIFLQLCCWRLELKVRVDWFEVADVSKNCGVFLSCCVRLESAILRSVGNFTSLHGLTFQNVYPFKTRWFIGNMTKFQVCLNGGNLPNYTDGEIDSKLNSCNVCYS